MLYIRPRTIFENTFLEFYLIYVNNCLTLPTEILERFNGRLHGPKENFLALPLGPDYDLGILKAHDFSLLEQPCTYKPDDNWINLQGVKSLGPNGASLRTKKDICSDGTWACFADLQPKGGSPLGAKPIISYIAVFLGVPIDPFVYRLLYWHRTCIYNYANSIGFVCSLSEEPRVVYHGSAKVNVKSILKNGFELTLGMFGLAIYFGSFWKAVRFATLTQEYEKRQGAVFRCYSFWSERPVLRYMARDPCECEKCLGHDTPGNRVADHLGLWKKSSDFVVAYPELGGPIKNEEYACASNKSIFIDTVGYINSNSEHHDPWDRKKIIE